MFEEPSNFQCVHTFHGHRSVLIVRQCETVTGCALASSDLVILHMFNLVLSEEASDHPYGRVTFSLICVNLSSGVFYDKCYIHDYCDCCAHAY